MITLYLIICTSIFCYAFAKKVETVWNIIRTICITFIIIRTNLFSAFFSLVFNTWVFIYRFNCFALLFFLTDCWSFFSNNCSIIWTTSSQFNTIISSNICTLIIGSISQSCTNFSLIYWYKIKMTINFNSACCSCYVSAFCYSNDSIAIIFLIST